MTIHPMHREVMRKAVRVLREAGVPSPEYDARELYEYAVACAEDMPEHTPEQTQCREVHGDAGVHIGKSAHASAVYTQCEAGRVHDGVILKHGVTRDSKLHLDIARDPELHPAITDATREFETRSHDDVPVVADIFNALIERRAAREPLQHILGVMYFRYLELESQAGVFIVRPETELVAEAGIKALRGKTRPTALDLCTGSGAIAISIATEVPGSEVWAIEKSAVAYESANRNALRYDAGVRFLLGDALEAATVLADVGSAPASFDLVISNPPYVPPYHDLDAEVLADPAEALFGGGDDGLDFPLAIIGIASELVAPGGVFVMEHAEEQAEKLCHAASQYFADVSTGYDYSGRPRWLMARR